MFQPPYYPNSTTDSRNTGQNIPNYQTIYYTLSSDEENDRETSSRNERKSSRRRDTLPPRAQTSIGMAVTTTKSTPDNGGLRMSSNIKRNSVQRAMPCYVYERTGSCAKGIHCPFTHQSVDPNPVRHFDPSAHPSYRTKPCFPYTYGDCLKGDACTFKHEPRSTRTPSPPPGQVPDVTSPQYRTRECNWFNTVGGCWYGSACKFKHTTPPSGLSRQASVPSAAELSSMPCQLYFTSPTGCPSGKSCMYSHSPASMSSPMFRLDLMQPNLLPPPPQAHQRSSMSRAAPSPATPTTSSGSSWRGGHGGNGHSSPETPEMPHAALKTGHSSSRRAPPYVMGSQNSLLVSQHGRQGSRYSDEYGHEYRGSDRGYQKSFDEEAEDVIVYTKFLNLNDNNGPSSPVHHNGHYAPRVRH